MVKIIIATIVKNEDDIVRQWIEYYGTIFGYDNLYIIDNFSTDNTYNICKEYLSKGIHLRRDPNYKLKGKFMTNIKNNTDCDIFIPLDIDEFICYYDKENKTLIKDSVLNYLESLITNDNKNGIYKMNYIMPIKTKNVNDLSKFTHGNYVDCKNRAKTFIIKKNVPSNFVFDHGNHVVTSDFILSDLVLLHYHHRTHNQLIKKVFANVTGLGHGFQLKKLKSIKGSVKGIHHVKKAIYILEHPKVILEPSLETNIDNKINITNILYSNV